MWNVDVENAVWQHLCPLLLTDFRIVQILMQILLTSYSGTCRMVFSLTQTSQEALGTINQLQATTSAISTVSVAGVQLPIADQMKVLGVMLDHCLTLDKHVSAVTQLCNCHACAIRHIRHF